VLKKMPARFRVVSTTKIACTMNDSVPNARMSRFFLPNDAKPRRRISTLRIVSRFG
jgi:hypothetical protein